MTGHNRIRTESKWRMSDALVRHLCEGFILATAILGVLSLVIL